MARGTLHAPKENAARRNAPTHADAVVTRDAETRGPELDEFTGRSDWDPQTRAWWERWRAAPMAQLFESTDWGRLALLARAVDYYNTAPKPPAAILSEIRMNEERLGATYADRLRVRIRIEAAGPAAPVVSISDAPSARQSVADRLARK